MLLPFSMNSCTKNSPAPDRFVTSFAGALCVVLVLDKPAKPCYGVSVE